MMLSLLVIGLLTLSQGQASTAAPGCIAHRAKGGGHLENSQSAMSWAMQSKVQGMEFDVLHTLDGVGIIMHDKTLERTAESKPGQRCPLKEKVGDLFWYEIDRACRLKNGEDVPTLEKTLELLSARRSDFYLFVELKDVPSARTRELLGAVARGPHWRLLSFDKDALDFMRPLGITSFYLYPLFLFPTNDYNINAHYLVPTLKRFKKYGEREIGVWTVNRPNRMLKAMIHGADFITTDYALLCLGVRELWQRWPFNMNREEKNF